MAVGEPLFRRIRDTDAPRVACDSETCRWQIEQATSTPVKHPIEILAEAYAAADRPGVMTSAARDEPAKHR
jgi:glycerol-3-phosphate dehydrogenase subunit C